MLLATDRRYKHYKANEDRIILKNELLLRKYYGETGSVNYYQILMPNEVLSLLMNNSGISTEKLVNILELSGR